MWSNERSRDRQRAGGGGPADDRTERGNGYPALSKATERFVWAVDRMRIRPCDHVLEIGCGHGVAASLVCDRLESGSLLAIDRSAKMIEMASRRNAAHIASGRAAFQCAALTTAKLDGREFDKIFAINVGVFLRGDASRELGVIREHLAAEGTFYSFAQAPHQMAAPGPGRLPDLLSARGFSLVDVISADLDTSRVVCVIAKRT